MDDQRTHFVLKLYPSAKERDNERDTLTKLMQTGESRVPHVHDSVECTSGFVLVLDRVGKTVRPVPGGFPVAGRHLAALVGALHTAHDCGIAHRDVKPQNIFLDSNDAIFLNDWGSSSALGECAAFVGTRGYCDAPGEAGVMVLWTADVDLRGLVRSAYAMVAGLAPPHDHTLAKEFWAERFAIDSLWTRAMGCANLLQYDGLAKELSQL